MPATDPHIISRAQWGANPAQTPAGTIRTPSPELYLHHSAGEQFGDAGMRMLQSFTLHRPDAHYSDLEYSYVIDHVSCQVYESRGPGHDSAATYNHNQISHAICVMGNFQIDEPSDALIRTLANLVAWGYERGWWPLGFTGGHRDASGNSTACPGDHLEVKLATINALAQQIHAGGVTPPSPKPRPLPKPVTTTGGRVIDEGDNVKTQLVTLTHKGFGLYEGAWDCGLGHPPTIIGAVVQGPAVSSKSGGDFPGSTDDWWTPTAGFTVRGQARDKFAVITGKVASDLPADQVPDSVLVNVTVA